MERTLLLNATFEPLKIISWQRAITLLTQGKVEVIDFYDREIRGVTISFKLPSILRLLKLVKVKRANQEVRFSRANIYLRDKYSCQYCGSKYPAEEEGFFSLVPGVFPRKVVWNLINTPIGKINFFNTHLSFNSASVRIQQVQQIVSYIENIETSNPAIASLLTGDFNDPPTSTSIQLLTNTGTDTFYISTFEAVNPGNPGYTFPSNSPNTRIDYVFSLLSGYKSNKFNWLEES